MPPYISPYGECPGAAGNTTPCSNRHVTLRLTVFEIFAVKWHKSVSERPKILHPSLFLDPTFGDLEMWVKGHSRSLRMVPFESLGTVSYSHFTVIMAVPLAISEIFSVR